MTGGGAVARGLDLGFIFVWVTDVASTARFYEEGLGLTPRFHVDGPQGPYVEYGSPEGGAGSDAGSVRFCISDIQEAHQLYGGDYERDFQSTPFALSFVDDDVPAVYRRAVAAGGISVTEPGRTACWGQMLARLRDPNGLLIVLVERTPPGQVIDRFLSEAGLEGAQAISGTAQRLNLLGERAGAQERNLTSPASDEDVVGLRNYLATIPDERLGELISEESIARMEAELVAQRVSNPPNG